MRTRVRLGAVLLVIGLAAGVTGGVMTAGASASPAVKSHMFASVRNPMKKVTIVDFAFSPRAITISNGTRVKWINTGAASHTSTSNTGKWDSRTIAPGDSFSRVFKHAGSFRYHCSIHPSMTGKIVVR